MFVLFRHNKLILQLILLGLLSSCGNSKSIQPKQNNSRVAFKEIFHSANSEKMIGHYETAIELYQKCLLLDPNSAASYYALATIYKTQNNSDKALEYGKTALKIDDNNKWYVAFLADTYFEIGDYHKSANYFQTLIDKHLDRHIENQSKLAQSYIYSNQKEKAIKALDNMELEVGVTPMTSLTKHDLYRELGKVKQANEALESLFTENPMNIEVRLEAMDYFLQTRQYENAEIVVRQINTIDSTNAFAKLGSAEIRLSKGQLLETFKLLSEALPSEEIEEERKLLILESLMGMAFDLRYPEANLINEKVQELMQSLVSSQLESGRFMSLYGRYLMQNNQKDSASIYFKKAVDLDVNNYEAWVNLLDARYVNEEYSSLVGEAEKALAVFPNQPMIYLLKGMAEYELADYLKSEETLTIGKNMVFDDADLAAEFKYHLAKNTWQQDNKELAVKQFESAFEGSPNNARFLFGYAQLLYAEGELGKAIKYAKKAAEQDQSIAKYAFFYANLLIEESNFSQAIKMIERALNIDIDNPTYMERYGDVMYFMNNVDKAVDIWQQTEKIQPSERLEKKINSKSYHD
jgi:tetratricopeptide (TPR) repeat protein